jgi:hypothetical protein
MVFLFPHPPIKCRERIFNWNKVAKIYPLYEQGYDIYCVGILRDGKSYMTVFAFPARVRISVNCWKHNPKSFNSDVRICVTNWWSRAFSHTTDGVYLVRPTLLQVLLHSIKLLKTMRKTWLWRYEMCRVQRSSAKCVMQPASFIASSACSFVHINSYWTCCSGVNVQTCVRELLGCSEWSLSCFSSDLP